MQDFTDVTLATEDDKQIIAHKVIVSSGSEFFRNLLIKNPHKNPLTYLKGIKHDECHVGSIELPSILATGTDLKGKWSHGKY